MGAYTPAYEREKESKACSDQDGFTRRFNRVTSGAYPLYTYTTAE